MNKTQELLTNSNCYALITGASRGIGYCYAKYLAEEGYNLILVANNEQELNTAAENLKNKYNKIVVTLYGDLKEKSFVTSICEKSSDLDVKVLINCAAFGGIEYFVKQDLNLLCDMVDVNVKSIVMLTHHFSRKWIIESKKGAIINVATVNVDFKEGIPFGNVYSATKFFVKSFSEGLFYELEPFGIVVMSVSPGPTDTGFQHNAGTNKLWFMESPNNVVRKTLKHLGKKPAIITNIVSNISVKFHNLIPFWRVRMNIRAHFFGQVLGNVSKLDKSDLR
ncbi:putative SDR family oxidoreductase [Gammaproteobacteria bacterium]